MLLEKREEGGWISTPHSIWWNSTPLMPPHTRRNWNGVAFHSWATVKMPGAVKPLLHASADAADLLQFEAEQSIGQVVFGDDDQAVRFPQSGTDFAEKHIRRDADRTGEAFADLIAQGPFDF
jgi:hypothetical protein